MFKSHFFYAFIKSFERLKPSYQIHNPVMFIVFIGSIFMSGIFIKEIFVSSQEPLWFIGHITFWLWFTVIFANFAEAIAQSKGKAQADSLKKSRVDLLAKKIENLQNTAAFKKVLATSLRKNDYVLIEAGDFVPADGQIVSGIASIDESAITGESAPVIREAGGDRDAATGGTKVLSDWIIIKVSSNPGESFLDKMIGLIESANRQKTPNEISLCILLAAMSIIFLLVCTTLLPYSIFSIEINNFGKEISITVIIALLVCLAPTTIGGLISAIGISGMQRLVKENVIATSARAIEAAGDVNVLLLDKTGTITFGNRQAVEFYPSLNITIEEMAKAASLSSISDETPEGKSIVSLACAKYGIENTNLASLNATFIPFTAEKRVSGILIDDRYILKGASDAIIEIVKSKNGIVPSNTLKEIENIARQGGTPLIVSNNNKILGVIYLKDVVKPDIKQRLIELRKMGIKSIMITGDNPITAASIASEAGVDDFIAQATPEAKLKYIRDVQNNGEMVAMVGDGTNDAPALAQSDVAVVMNSGTQTAKEAGNMIDLDSDPTKLIEIVKIAKQLLITRGIITTFSISNDLAKYFAIIPAAFASFYPALFKLNIMGLTTPYSAILSAVIFNAIIIIALIPLAIKGVNYIPESASAMLKKNILIYGVGGIIVPFIGIKIIDLIITSVGLA